MKQFLSSFARNIKSNVLISIINMWGLVFGFVCVMFIFIWIKNELSFDRFHNNSHEIYRLHRYFYDNNGAVNLHLPAVAPVITPLIRNDFPEIQSMARSYYIDMVFSSGETKMAEHKIVCSDPEILKIFDFKGLPADNNLLKAPFTVIISDVQAQKYFHTTDAIGKNLEFKDERGKKYNLQVTGVFKAWKGNSHFNPDFFVSFSTLESFFDKSEFTDWGSNNYETFALIPHYPADMDTRLDAFIDKNYDNKGSKGTKIRFEKLTDIHFNWYSTRSYVYILTSIALLILIIGSINYMNLNAAIYSKRIKEIKIRKILGVSQKKLAFWLMSESVIFCFIALLLAMCIVPFAIEYIKVSDNELKFRLTENLGLVSGFIILPIVTGLVSGIYPSLVMASFKPILSGSEEKVYPGKSPMRNALVVFQFMVSTGLIISFLVVSRQLNYVNDKELGLNKENIIVVPATPKIIEKLEVFKQQLTQNNGIVSASASKRVPSDGLMDSNGASVVSEGIASPVGFRIANVRTDRDFIPTYGVKLLAGRNFNENIATDSGYIINESTVRKIGWKSPDDAIGKLIKYGRHTGQVIGVVQDFNYESLHNPVSPVILYYDPQSFNRISIKIRPEERTKSLSAIEKLWQSYNVSDDTFSYEYLTDKFNRLYAAESKMKLIFTWLMFLAISISILGMVGLSFFFIERRTKEIGLRKINGARISEIMLLLNRDLSRWVLLAFVIVCPIVWYAMHKWLGNFAYRTTLSWWLFVLAGLIALTIALATVSWQSWHAATRNPVDALRHD
jgi:putative ABC transport system permease protein